MPNGSEIVILSENLSEKINVKSNLPLGDLFGLLCSIMAVSPTPGISTHAVEVCSDYKAPKI